MATVLYTAMTNLWVSSAIASWPCPAGNVLPLDPAKQSTINLLAAGSIEPAPGGAVDNTSPPRIVRGMAGLHIAVSN